MEKDKSPIGKSKKERKIKKIKINHNKKKVIAKKEMIRTKLIKIVRRIKRLKWMYN